MESLLNPEALIVSYGYLGIFLTVLLETSVFFPLPGDSLLFTAGVLASADYVNLAFVLFLVFIGAVLGGIVGYAVGVYLDKLRRYSFFRKILKDEYIAEGHKFFEKHGSLAIVFARFIPIIRTFTPIAAGIARMGLAKYVKWNIISAMIWPLLIVNSGYFLGKIFPNLGNHLQWLIFAVVIVSFIPAIISFAKKMRRRLARSKRPPDRA